jgi:hypothetical protein
MRSPVRRPLARFRRWSLCAALALLVLFPALRPTAAEAAPGDGTGQLIVELEPGASHSLVNAVLHLKLWKVAASGLEMDEESGLGDLLLIKSKGGPLSATQSVVAAALRLLPTVARVEENVETAIGGKYGGEQSQTPIFVDELNLASMREQPAIEITGLEPPETPSGNPAVRVAVLDGGFDLGHETLDGRTDDGWDTIDHDSDPEDAGNGVDDDGDDVTDSGVGHGTAVAGLIAVAAPEAVIVPVRVLDDEGLGTVFAMADGIRYAMAMGVSVINLSAGSPGPSVIVETALEHARDMGILVVTSAGNTGDSNPTYPGSSAYVLSVTGVTDEGARDPDASVGPAVDLAAPSLDIAAPYPGTVDGYGLWFGTSFSCALTSAAIARVLQQEQGSPLDAGEDILESAADFPSAAEPWSAYMGAGILDADPLLDD